MLWFPHYWVKSHREIPVLWRKAGAGKVPPFAGRKLESEEWWNKKSNTRMEELIVLAWPLEVKTRNWDWIANYWICIKPPLQSWNPVDWILRVAHWSWGEPVMMKQRFSRHFNTVNCALLGCSNIRAGWDFSNSPLAEALLCPSPWAREACLSLLPSLCCAAHSALPCPRLWAGFHHWGVSLGFPAVCQECSPYRSGGKGKFTWAPLNGIFTHCFSRV